MDIYETAWRTAWAEAEKAEDLEQLSRLNDAGANHTYTITDWQAACSEAGIEVKQDLI